MYTFYKILLIVIFISFITGNIVLIIERSKEKKSKKRIFDEEII